MPCGAYVTAGSSQHDGRTLGRLVRDVVRDAGQPHRGRDVDDGPCARREHVWDYRLHAQHHPDCADLEDEPRISSTVSSCTGLPLPRRPALFTKTFGAPTSPCTPSAHRPRLPRSSRRARETGSGRAHRPACGRAPRQARGYQWRVPWRRSRGGAPRSQPPMPVAAPETIAILPRRVMASGTKSFRWDWRSRCRRRAKLGRRRGRLTDNQHCG